MKLEGTKERQPSAKKASYYDYDRPPIHVQYDTVNQYPSMYGQPAMYYNSIPSYHPVVYNPAMGNIPPPPPLPAEMGFNPVVYDAATGTIPPPPPLPPAYANELDSNSSNLVQPAMKPTEANTESFFTSTVKPPPPTDNGHAKTSDISPPPPPPENEQENEQEKEKEDEQSSKEPGVKYNFNYEDAMAEENLVGIPLSLV